MEKLFWAWSSKKFILRGSVIKTFLKIFFAYDTKVQKVGFEIIIILTFLQIKFWVDFLLF